MLRNSTANFEAGVWFLCKLTDLLGFSLCLSACASICCFALVVAPRSLCVVAIIRGNAQFSSSVLRALVIEFFVLREASLLHFFLLRTVYTLLLFLSTLTFGEAYTWIRRRFGGGRLGGGAPRRRARGRKVRTWRPSELGIGLGRAFERLVEGGKFHPVHLHLRHPKVGIAGPRVWEPGAHPDPPRIRGDVHVARARAHPFFVEVEYHASVVRVGVPVEAPGVELAVVCSDGEPCVACGVIFLGNKCVQQRVVEIYVDCSRPRTARELYVDLVVEDIRSGDRPAVVVVVIIVKGPEGGARSELWRRLHPHLVLPRAEVVSGGYGAASPYAVFPSGYLIANFIDTLHRAIIKRSMSLKDDPIALDLHVVVHDTSVLVHAWFRPPGCVGNEPFAIVKTATGKFLEKRLARGATNGSTCGWFGGGWFGGMPAFDLFSARRTVHSFEYVNYSVRKKVGLFLALFPTDLICYLNGETRDGDFGVADVDSYFAVERKIFFDLRSPFAVFLAVHDEFLF
mmetsp:Transcript_13162/g.26247  ORF Transcript_13162/g.26247 Transcript_13162/m.26247 type:complete len:512 (+) Transcript_13162:124-1659(+)